MEKRCIQTLGFWVSVYWWSWQKWRQGEGMQAERKTERGQWKDLSFQGLSSLTYFLQCIQLWLYLWVNLVMKIKSWWANQISGAHSLAKEALAVWLLRGWFMSKLQPLLMTFEYRSAVEHKITARAAIFYCKFKPLFFPPGFLCEFQKCKAVSRITKAWTHYLSPHEKQNLCDILLNGSKLMYTECDVLYLLPGAQILKLYFSVYFNCTNLS